MGSFSIGHWAIVLVIVLLLFGTNRLSSLMGDVAKGVKEFKKGLQDSEDPTPLPSRPMDALPDAAGKPIAHGENV